MRAITGILLLLQCALVQAQNPLVIPPALTGSTFNLTVQTGTQIFYGNTPTPTYGINGSWMSPTIIVNKDDSITLNVINNLPVKTTMHWHGLHVSAMNDGGPHQSINPNTTWSPSFKVRNNASTFWYHPHGAGQTDPQVSKGLAGLFIVKDAAEAALNLPRTYGIDDIPIIVQSKSFDDLQQIAIASDMDTALFVNGTLNPFFNAPAQVIRFRLLNGSSLRSYNFGLSNGQTFYQIGTDGGLLDTSLALTRLRLSPGERAEILIDFSGMVSQTIYLKSYGSELLTGIYGADVVGFGADTIHEYEDNFLNGLDFNLLRLNIVSSTGNPVTTIPNALIPYVPFDVVNATNYRTIVMDTIRMLPIDVPNLAEGPFGMNNQTFDMDVVNDTVHLNTTEVWMLINKTLIAHPFHIHDIQFNILESSGMPPVASEAGWKDVVLVMPGDTVKFITKFETFADDMTPYMYHCHLLHHEDDGMMGSFLVIDTTATGISETHFGNAFSVYPNPTSDVLNIATTGNEKYTVTIFNSLGLQVYSSGQAISNLQIETSTFPAGIYFLQINSKNTTITKKIIKQ
ncbi:MAG: multicopper oxidase domain-containing protein [Sphingobacteriales bacterium JAD_PAG50586_3]|nr:MAG: multicopper oxidase domain-containing protein [Sphingobacteriales bacterium JAD_PAG50586_3]